MHAYDIPKPTKACIFYDELYSLEHKNDYDSDEDIPKVDSNGIEIIKKKYKTPEYLNPYFYDKKKNKKFIDANETNNILKIRTGTYPFMNLLKHKYKIIHIEP